MTSIFDEDSSSEDEAPASASAPAPAPVLNSDLHDSPSKLVIHDDEEDDGNGMQAGGDGSRPTIDGGGEGAGGGEYHEQQQQQKVTYNPDEDDVEFDGDGAIVGSSARPPPAAAGNKRTVKPQEMTVLQAQRPTNVSLHMVKLPNIVGIQTEPFDPDTYSAAQEEEEFNGFVPNMIRWRYTKDEDGNFQRDSNNKLLRESNTRLVKWDDGTFSLHVGKEVFQVDSINSAQANGYAGLNGYLYMSQKATFHDDDDNKAPGGTVLECMGAVKSKLIPRPSSLQSEAHKSLTVAVRQKTIKRARIAQYVTQEDPEKAKEARIRNKQDLDRANARKQYRSGYTRRPGMNRRFMEEDEDGYDSINVGNLRRRNNEEDFMDYGVDNDDDDDDDDEEEDDGWGQGRLAARRQQRQRRGGYDESEDEEEFALGQESDEEEAITRTKPGKKRAHQVLVDDDED